MMNENKFYIIDPIIELPKCQLNLQNMTSIFRQDRKVAKIMKTDEIIRPINTYRNDGE